MTANKHAYNSRDVIMHVAAQFEGDNKYVEEMEGLSPLRTMES